MIGFWIFMLVSDLLIPGMMILFGWLFLNRPPKEINSFYGYRTSMSTKNKDTWDFAHQYFGRLWYRAGWILLPLTAAAMLSVLGKGDGVVGICGGIICGIQCIFMIGMILPTERALRRNFDKNGKRIL